jgi:hypothetical protein
MAQMVEGLPSKCKISSNPGITKKKKKKKKKKNQAKAAEALCSPTYLSSFAIGPWLQKLLYRCLRGK